MLLFICQDHIYLQQACIGEKLKLKSDFFRLTGTSIVEQQEFKHLVPGRHEGDMGEAGLPLAAHHVCTG